MRNLRDCRLPATLEAIALMICLLAGGALGAGAASAAVAPATTILAERSAKATTLKELRALEAFSKGRIGAYAVDTAATGKTIAYEPGERHPMLSTFTAIAAGAADDKIIADTATILARGLGRL